MHARSIAEELWRRYGLSIPLDLKRLTADLDLQVVSFPFSGRIREMIVGRTIGVQPGLSRPWFRWYVAHAIGHHHLHVGPLFQPRGWHWVSHAKAERQAEEFAAYLMGGPGGWHRTATELAVPREKLPLIRRTTAQADPLRESWRGPEAPSRRHPALSPRSPYWRNLP